MRKPFIIRRTVRGVEKSSSGYVVERVRRIGRAMGGCYRFAKTSTYDAEIFDKNTAQKVLRSIRRNDPHRDHSKYSIVEF